MPGDRVAQCGRGQLVCRGVCAAVIADLLRSGSKVYPAAPNSTQQRELVARYRTYDIDAMHAFQLNISKRWYNLR